MKLKKTLAALLCLALLLAGAPALAAEGDGEICVLFTSDIHCGIDEGFGLVGLRQIRDTLEAKGYEVLLVDDGDAIQGEAIGLVTRGEAIVRLMNDAGYDAAIPGNHEFSYGMDQFLALTELAEYPYISCNLTYLDELVLAPYVILEAAGHKIGFVGVTTPETLTSSTPKYFQNEAGEYVYGFMRDETGQALYTAVQSAVDGARAEGAELVCVMGHLGYFAEDRPWTYAEVIENTTGIDIFFDGHSHDAEQAAVKNAAGEEVLRIAVGTKLDHIGYCYISADGGIREAGAWVWPNADAAPALLGLSNDMTLRVEEVEQEVQDLLSEVVGRTEVHLTICDPVETTGDGSPIRMVRRAETNMGDFCADALRARTGADIALISGGNIRADILAGDITYDNILNVMPFGNDICLLSVTGQMILDALEWGARALPAEFGGFPQVSGLTYEIDAGVGSTCTSDENGMFTGVAGDRRVSNVLVGGEPIDPEGTYTLAGTDYTLLDDGDGFSMFDGAEVISEGVCLDSQALIDYLTEDLGGTVGAEYADGYGQGRIVITE